MITLHNFNEAIQQHQLGVIPMRLLQEQALVLLGICSNCYEMPESALHITNKEVEWLLQQAEATFDYSEMLGGYVYICQTHADLQQIKGCDFEWAETHGGWPNVTDIAMSWDACECLNEADEAPQWVMFLMCWNNAGGPVYYLPKHLWAMARVAEHIAATSSM